MQDLIRKRLGLDADGMTELDDDVGELIDFLETLDVDEITPVMFATNNGAASNSWPDGGNQPFRGENGAGGYVGGFRVPVVVKRPGKIPAGDATGGFMAMEGWLPTFMSTLGQPNLREQLLDGHPVGDKTYRVHLDGVDQSDLANGQGPVGV